MNDIAPILSVIIPAFNAGATLKNTVDSVLSQTLTNIDIWIVDDGSKDNTSQLADALALRDARVHVIHKENGGCYQARLAALKQIRTEWFGFVDADDTIEPLMYERMVEVATKYGLDVVQIDTIGTVDKGLEIYSDRCEVLNSIVVPHLVYGRKTMHVWDKIYRNIYKFESFLDSHVTMFEDHIFNLQFFLPIRKVGLLHEAFYGYNVNALSSVKNYKKKNLIDLEEAISIREAIIPRYGCLVPAETYGHWILWNFINFLTVAALSPGVIYAQRCTYVNELLHSNSLRKTVYRFNSDVKAILFRVAFHLPVALVIAVIWSIRALHRVANFVNSKCRD